MESKCKSGETISLDYPYHIIANTKEEAADTIRNMCNNCERNINCTGAESEKCNDIKEFLVEIFK